MRRSSRRRPWWARTWDESAPSVQFIVLALAMGIGLTVAVVIFVSFPPH